MAMDLNCKLSYPRRFFPRLLAFMWTLVGCFMHFHNGREKPLKAERPNARLQLPNLR